MLARLALAAAVVALAGCAGMESAGRNAARNPAPRTVSAPAPAPRTVAPAPTPTTAPPSPAVTPSPSQGVASAAPPPVATAPAPVAAPQPEPAQTVAPTPAPPTPVSRASRAGDEEVVVPGQRERQVPTPADPRSTAERMQDIRAWDQCVMRVQSAFDADPMSPQLEVPEDYCARSLGMASRTAVPESRLQRR